MSRRWLNFVAMAPDERRCPDDGICEEIGKLLLFNQRHEFCSIRISQIPDRNIAFRSVVGASEQECQRPADPG